MFTYDHPTSKVATPAPAEAAPADSLLNYDSMTPAEPTIVPDEDLLSPEVKALRADPERLRYDVQPVYDAIKDSPTMPESQRAVNHEIREVFADLSLDSQEAREVVDLVVGLKELPSDETVAAWSHQALAQLHQTYGKDAQQALQDARKLINRDPRLREFLGFSGLGSNPRVVQLIASKARSLKGRGKL